MTTPQSGTPQAASPARHRHATLLLWAVNTARVLLAATLLLSGLIKANDPIGTQIKLGDYLTALHLGSAASTLAQLGLALALAFAEFTLGITLALGLYRRLTATLTLLFTAAMTILTVWVFVADPVSDCGCFGDAIILTNGQTLAKNVVLLAASLLIHRWHRLQPALLGRSTAWIVHTPAMAGIVLFSLHSIYSLPAVDFRPYRLGTDLRAALRPDEGALPQYDIKIVYRRGAEQLLLDTEDDDPDSTWTYVETRRTPLTATAPDVSLADFSLLDPASREDVTADILDTRGYTFLLVAPDLDNADQGCAGNVNELHDYARAHHHAFWCLTASLPAARDRWTDYTGAEYPYLLADGRTLRTVVRANPGLVLLHDGVIVGKWSNWNIPDDPRQCIRQAADNERRAHKNK